MNALCELKCPNCSRWGIGLDDDGESKCSGCQHVHMQEGLERRAATIRRYCPPPWEELRCRCWVEELTHPPITGSVGE